MPYVALDQAPVPTETPAGFDFHAALTDYDTWEKGLPQQQRDILQRRFALSDDVEADRRRFLSVGYVAQATGHPVKDVSEQFENWYMPGFAKSPKGLALTAAPADVNGFFGELTKKVKGDKEAEGIRDSARINALISALNGEDPIAALGNWQGGVIKSAGFKPSMNQDFMASYAQAGTVLGKHRDATNQFMEALQRNMQGAPKDGDDETLAEFRERLIDMPDNERSLVLGAMAGKAQTLGGQSDKSGVGGFVQQMGEGLARFMTSDTSFSEVSLSQVADSEGANVVTRLAKITNAQEARQFVDEQAKANVAQAFGAIASSGTAGLPTVRRDGEERQLAKDEAALVVAAKQRAAKGIDIGRQVRNLANQTDPVGNVAGSLGTSLALMGGLMTGGAALVPVTAQLYATNNYEQLRLSNPDIPPQTARNIALASGAIEGALDLWDVKIFKGLPSVKNLIQGGLTKELVRSTARGFAGSVAAEMTQESVQDLALPAVTMALASDVPSVDWRREMQDFAGSRLDTFLAVLPLTLIGAGVATVKDFNGFRDVVATNEVLGRAGYAEPDRVNILELRQNGTDEQLQAAILDAAPRRSPEIAAEFGADDKQTGLIEASKVVDELTRRGGYTLTRSDDGWTVTTPDNKTVKTERAGEAVALMARDFSEAELRNASAVADMADAFLMQKRGGESVEVTPGKARDIKDDVAEGRITPESAREAIVTAGRLAGLTEAESMQQIGAVLGSSTIEENEGVREAVGRIYRGANAMTVVEETIEGRWTRGLESKRYTPQQGETWVRLAEQATGESYLPADYSARDLVEAISHIVKADVLGRRKDGARLAPGLVSRGVREAAMQGSKDAGKFAAFLSSFRALFKRVFSTARKLAAARAEGKINQDWENLMDDLLGLDSQARYENSVTREASDLVDPDSLAYTPKDGESFSLAPRVTQDQDDAYLSAVQAGDMATAQRMVDEAAKAAGFTTEAWHGSSHGTFPTFQIPDTPDPEYGIKAVFFTEEKPDGSGQTTAERASTGGGYRESGGKPKIYHVFLKPGKTLDTSVKLASLSKTERADVDDYINASGAALAGGIEAYLERRPKADIADFMYAAGDSHFGDGETDVGSAFSAVWDSIHDRARSTWVITDPSRIKSADPVTRDAQGNVIPLSQRFNPQSDSISYSLAPRSLAARVQSAAEKKMGDPEFRAKVFQEMQRRLGALREDSTFHNFGRGEKTIVGQDATAGENWIKERATQIAAEKKQGLPPQVLADSARELKDVADPDERLRVKEARQAIRDLETEARQQARAEAPSSPEYNDQQRSKLIAALRTLDAMTSVLPAEVRGKLGGATKLASLKTDEARARALLEKLDKADAELEKYMKRDFTKRFVKLLEQSKAKGGGGDKPEGKLGAFGHEWFDDVRAAFDLDSEAAEKRIAELQGLLVAPDLDPVKGDEYLRELTMVEVFGGWESMDAAEMSDALESAKEMFTQSRKAWTQKLVDRRAADQEKQRQVIEALGTGGDLASKSSGAAKRKAAPAGTVLGNLARFMMTPEQMLRSWLGQKNKLAEAYTKAEMKAQMRNRDEVLASEDGLQQAIGSAIGATENTMAARKRRNQWLYDKTTMEREVSILIGREVTTDSLELEDARDIVQNEEKAYTAKQRETMRAQIEMADLAKELGTMEGRKKRVTFEQVKSDGERQVARFTEAEISWFLALHDQKKLRPALEASGFDAQAIEAMRGLESPEMREVRRWMVDVLKREHGSITRIYADLRGVNLPQIENYFPARFVHDGDTAAPTPGSQGAAANGMMGTGALRNRKTHAAQVAFDADNHTINLFSLFWKHRAEMSYWKAYAPLAREIKSVFNRGSVKQAFEARFGEGQVRELNAWVKSIENGGLDAGHMNDQVNGWLHRVLAGNAANALGLKIGTNLVNLTSALNAGLDTAIPFNEAMRSYGRVMSGQSVVSPAEVWNLPGIQRRIKGGVNPMAQIIKQAAQAAKPGLAADINMAGFYTIGIADSLGGSVAAAVSYDAHYRQAIAAGMSEAEASAVATDGMQQTIARTFQPTEQSAKALYELNPNIAWRMFTMFASEARQKIGIEIAAVEGALKGEIPKADALRVVAINHLMIGTLVWALKSLARDLQKGDDGDDDPSWEWKDWLASVLVGPLSGVPFVGSAATWATARLTGIQAYSSTENPVLEGLGDLYGGGKGLVNQIMGEPNRTRKSEFMRAMDNTNRLIHGVSSVVGGPLASAVSIVGNGVTQVAGIVDNAVKD